MLLEVLLIVAVLLFLIYKKTCTIPPGLPPGSFGLPVLGTLPPRNQPLSQHFAKLRHKYGMIFTTKWGSHPLVVITDLHLIKKAYNHPDLQGRKEFHSLEIMNKSKNSGVLFSDGRQWALSRRWLTCMVRDLIVNKSALESRIHEEAAMLVKHFEQQNLDEPVEVHWRINVAVFSVIFQMSAGLGYETDNKNVLEFIKMLDEDAVNLQGPMSMLDIFPWLIPFVPAIIYDRVLKGEIFHKNLQNFRSVAQEIILNHARKLDPTNPLDIIDLYLLEIEKEKDNPDTIFKADYSDLIVLMHDMFSANTESTSNTLRWMVLYMVTYPQVQEKVHAELDREVPRDRLPSLDDRPRIYIFFNTPPFLVRLIAVIVPYGYRCLRRMLPYVDATILDVLRLSSFASFGVQHAATADVQLEEYTIPKGTLMLACLEYLHHDPALWEKPNELYPEHFLDSEGNLDSKKEGFYPFGLGRRQCLGEPLARIELFLFTAAILQRFEITAPPGVTLDLGNDLNKYITNAPKPFKVMLKKRFA